MKLRRDNWAVITLSSLLGMVVYALTYLALNQLYPKQATQNLIISFVLGLIVSVVARPLLVRLTARFFPPPPQPGKRAPGSAPTTRDVPQAVVRAKLRRSRREQKLKNRTAREARQRRAKSGKA